MAKGLGSTLTKIPTSSITDSSVGITNLVTSGTASSSTFLKGDLSWASVSVGGKINVVASDPATTVAGDIWYADGRFKFAIDANEVGGAWSTGGNVNVGRAQCGGNGALEAGLIFGGNSYINSTEEYNGTSWTTVNNLLAGSTYTQGMGTQSAAVQVGGRLSGGASTANCYNYNGTSWSATGGLSVATEKIGTAGTSTAGLSFSGGISGGSPSGVSDVTQTFDGSTWTLVNSMLVSRYGPAAYWGTQSSALCYGGNSANPSTFANTETYNGTSWSAASDGLYSLQMGMCAGASNQEGMCFGPTNYTQYWDGTSWSRLQDVANMSEDGSGGGNTSAAWCAKTNTMEWHRPVLRFIGT